jgi:chemotaxis protein MotB
MAGHGGGAWKVAYADFVTAMMAFFLVMWIVAQNDKVKQAVAHYFTDPYNESGRVFDDNAKIKAVVPSDDPANKSGGGKGPRGKGRGRGAPLKDAAETDPNAKTGRKPQVFVLHDGQKSLSGTVVPFALHSADLDERAKLLLGDVVPTMLGKPNKIEVRGHTVHGQIPPSAAYKDDWQLSYARCMAVMAYLKQKGIEADRIRISQAGAFEPLTLSLEPDAQARNARADVYMVAEFAGDLQGTQTEREQYFESPINPAPSDRKSAPDPKTKSNGKTKPGAKSDSDAKPKSDPKSKSAPASKPGEDSKSGPESKPAAGSDSSHP